MRKLQRRALTAALLAAALPLAAHAATLDTVRQTNTVHCGATARAGFADLAEDGRITGLGVDMCRALTIAVLGPNGRTEFHLYDSDRDYAAAATDDAAFLAADAVAQHGLAAALVPGPVVYIAELSLLVHPTTPADLATTTVCFMNGSPAHQALEAWATRTHTALARIGFQEDLELQDGFDASRCGAMAGEASELAAFRAESPARRAARILPPLALMPIAVDTPVADGAWAALVGWVMQAVVQSEAAPNPWRSDPPGAALPGLRTGWLADVQVVLGPYPAMVDRNFGSRLAMGPGPNAAWPEGLMLPPGPR